MTGPKPGKPKPEKRGTWVKHGHGKRYLVVGVVIIAVIVGALLFSSAPSVRAAPDFTVTDVYGNQFTLSANRGKPVIVNFITLTCSSCVALIPSFVELWNSDGPRMQMVWLDIGWSFSGYDDSEIRAFLDDVSNKLGSRPDWVWARDPGGIAQSYGAVSLRIFVIDKDGNIAFEALEPFSFGSVRGAIDRYVQ